MGSAIAGKGDLHAPHRPVSAMCFAGTRFCFPHDGQARTMAMGILSWRDAAKTLLRARASMNRRSFDWFGGALQTGSWFPTHGAIGLRHGWGTRQVKE